MRDIGAIVRLNREATRDMAQVNYRKKLQEFVNRLYELEPVEDVLKDMEEVLNND